MGFYYLYHDAVRKCNRSPAWTPGGAITGGILGTPGLIPNNPHAGRYVVPLHENNPSVPRSDVLRWKEVPAEIPAGCSPKKRLPLRSSARGYQDVSLFYHKLLLAADQSRNQIIMRMPINLCRFSSLGLIWGKKCNFSCDWAAGIISIHHSDLFYCRYL